MAPAIFPVPINPNFILLLPVLSMLLSKFFFPSFYGKRFFFLQRYLLCIDPFDGNKLILIQSHQKFIDQSFPSLYFHGHCSVPFISRPSGQSQRQCKIFCSITKSYALNLSMNDKMFSLLPTFHHHFLLFLCPTYHTVSPCQYSD